MGQLFFNLLMIVSFSDCVKVRLLFESVLKGVCNVMLSSIDALKVFSFEKNSGGKNPPGPLSYITLNTKTGEELPRGLALFPATLVFFWYF